MQRVAHDVLNVHEMLVLKKGTMLTPVFIERLRNYEERELDPDLDGPVEDWVGEHVM